MLFDFHTTTYGKWILAGEHAVLRGYPALAFPIYDKTLTLSYRKVTDTLQADYSGTSGADMQLLFWSVLEHGLHLMQRSLQNVSGLFHIESNIPVGVGMGASAALCVAVARWFVVEQDLPEQNLYDFAKQLEHLFHGQSSGLDVASVAAENGIYFQQGTCQKIQQAWQPYWYLSSCGQMGITSHCIQKVQELYQAQPALAKELDCDMYVSVKQARNALETFSPTSLAELTAAIKKANSCFHAWDLVSENLAQHMRHLLNVGALAVKPTGSGKGGYVLSLWDKPQPTIPQAGSMFLLL